MSSRMWRAIKRHLKFKGVACCGSSWPIREDEGGGGGEEEEEDEAHIEVHEQAQYSYTFQNQFPGGRYMSLATALQFDRHLLKVDPKIHHMPLMTLFEEIDSPDHATIKWHNYNNDGGTDGTCCVCMERNRDAAFISCGHAYCRPCAQDLWSNRGSCPLCNRRIDDILNIY